MQVVLNAMSPRLLWSQIHWPAPAEMSSPLVYFPSQFWSLEPGLTLIPRNPPGSAHFRRISRSSQPRRSSVSSSHTHQDAQFEQELEEIRRYEDFTTIGMTTQDRRLTSRLDTRCSSRAIPAAADFTRKTTDLERANTDFNQTFWRRRSLDSGYPDRFV